SVLSCRPRRGSKGEDGKRELTRQFRMPHRGCAPGGVSPGRDTEGPIRRRKSRNRVQRPNDKVAVGMPMARLLSRSHVEIALGYLAGYVLLDWLSYVHPFGSFGITPWNPQTGLSFALILLFGAEFMPWLLVAPVLADGLVRGFVLPLGAEMAAAVVIGGGYALATGLLLLPRLRFDLALGSRRSLVLLAAVAVASTAVVAAIYVAMLVAFAILPTADFGRAALRFWVGDVIGITVLTPFLLVLMTRRRLIPPSWE